MWSCKTELGTFHYIFVYVGFSLFGNTVHWLRGIFNFFFLFVYTSQWAIISEPEVRFERLYIEQYQEWIGEKNSPELDLTNYFRSQDWILKRYRSWFKWNKFVCLENINWRRLDFGIDSASNLTALPMLIKWVGGWHGHDKAFITKGLNK